MESPGSLRGFLLCALDGFRTRYGWPNTCVPPSCSRTCADQLWRLKFASHASAAFDRTFARDNLAELDSDPDAFEGAGVNIVGEVLDEPAEDGDFTNTGADSGRTQEPHLLPGGGSWGRSKRSAQALFFFRASFQDLSARPTTFIVRKNPIRHQGSTSLPAS